MEFGICFRNFNWMLILILSYIVLIIKENRFVNYIYD